MMKASLAIRFLLAAATLGCTAAQAQLFRSYLAADGHDANACTITSPCRLLPRALQVVASGGEIWMLDSANYNGAPVAIDKSVSIIAIPGVVGSLVVTSAGPAVTIAAPGLKVALRNVSIGPLIGATPLPAGGTYGVFMTGASILTIENGLIANVPNDAIRVIGAGQLRVVNTTLRGNGGRAIVLGEGARAVISEARMLDNTFGGVLVASGGVAATTTASVSDSLISGVLGGGFGVSAATTTAGATTRVSVTRSTIRRASYALMSGTGDSGGAAEVNFGGSMIVDNEFAWSQSGSNATILSLGNNQVTGNGGTFGTKSPLTPQ